MELQYKIQESCAFRPDFELLPVSLTFSVATARVAQSRNAKRAAFVAEMGCATFKVLSASKIISGRIIYAIAPAILYKKLMTSFTQIQ